MTDVINTFTSAFDCIRDNLDKFLIFAVLSLITGLSGILTGFGLSGIFVNLIEVVGMVVSFIVTGYLLNIIRETSSSSNKLPEFNWMDDLVNGIKNDILLFIYFIIPVIIITIVAIATTNAGAVNNLLTYISAHPNVAIPGNLVTPVLGSLATVIIVSFILFVLFGLLAFIGECRLAKSGSLRDGLDIGAVISDIGNIGWVSLILWVIIAIIIIMIISAIGSLILYIPVIGSILNALIITPFILAFISAAQGYLYSSS